MSSDDNVINVSDSNTAPDKKLNKMQKSMMRALMGKNIDKSKMMPRRIFKRHLMSSRKEYKKS
jgi:hypothetical protein